MDFVLPNVGFLMLTKQINSVLFHLNFRYFIILFIRLNQALSVCLTQTLSTFLDSV